MKVKENREILSPLGYLPRKMPNVRGPAESYPATSTRDWPTTRSSSRGLFTNSLKTGLPQKLFPSKVLQPDLIVKYQGLKLSKPSLNKSLGTQVTCKGFSYVNTFICLRGHRAQRWNTGPGAKETGLDPGPPLNTMVILLMPSFLILGIIQNPSEKVVVKLKLKVLTQWSTLFSKC